MTNNRALTMVGKVLVIPELRGGKGDELREIEMETDTLTMLYREIGCRTVEVVHLTDRLVPGLDLWLDEEFAFTDSPQYNVRAMALVLGAVGELHDWQTYCGRAVVARVDAHGETVGLTPKEMKLVRLAIHQASGQVEAWMGARSVKRS